MSIIFGFRQCWPMVICPFLAVMSWIIVCGAGSASLCGLPGRVVGSLGKMCFGAGCVSLKAEASGAA